MLPFMGLCLYPQDGEFEPYDLKIYDAVTTRMMENHFEESITTLNEILASPALSKEESIYGSILKGYCYRKLYDFDRSLEILDSVKIVIDKNLPAIDPIRGFFGEIRGDLGKFSGDYFNAYKYLEQSLEIRTKLFGEESCITAISLKAIGELYYFFFDDYNNATPYFEKSFNIISKCKNAPSSLKVLAYYNLSLLYYRKKEHNYAKELALKALSLAEQNIHQNGRLLPFLNTNLSLICIGMNSNKEAINYSKKAQSLRLKYQPNNLERICYDYYNLGYIYSMTMDFSSSNDILLEGLSFMNQIRIKNPNLDIEDIIYFSEIEIASNYAQIGDSLTASKYALLHFNELQNRLGECSYRSILHLYQISEIFDIIKNYPDAIRLIKKSIQCYDGLMLNEFDFYHIAANYAMLADLEFKTSTENAHTNPNVISHYQKADSLFKIAKLNSTWQNSKIEYGASTDEIYKNILAQIDNFYQKQPSEELCKNAFQFIESTKSFLLFESLNTSLQINTESNDSSITLLNKINRDISIEESKESSAIDYELLESLKQQKKQALAQIDGFSFDRNINTFYKNLISAKELQSRLKPNEVVFQFFELSDTIFYRVKITALDMSFDKIKVGNQLNEFIALFNSFEPSLFTNAALNSYQNIAYELFNLFCFGLDQNINELIIIPDGPLNFIPFEALVSQRTKTASSFASLPYLIKDYNIRYAYSIAHLYNTSRKRIEQSQNLSFLPIDDFMGNSTSKKNFLKRFFDLDASQNKTESLTNIQHQHALHFSSHGFLDSVNADYNYLKLNDSIKLYSYEIASLNLAADIVFLNACESNKGQFHKGEGMFSLARSFLQAGCETTIASLWQIPYGVSDKISLGFYKQLNEDQTVSQALRQSKLDFLLEDQQDAHYKHPYYWAGLTLIGNDEPIVFEKKSSSKKKIFLFGFGFILIILLFFGFKKMKN